jgi:hypothetical protein
LIRATVPNWRRSRKAMAGVAFVVGTLVLGAGAGIAALKHTNLALILSAAALATSVLLLKDARENIFGGGGWIPYAWIALSLAPDHHFTVRSTLDNSVSSASPDNYVQLATYMLVAALVLHHRRLLLTGHPRSLRKGPFIAWPTIALVSTLWSLVPLFTFIRALQLFVPIALALLMVRIWLISPDVAADIWNRTLRLFVQTVTILVFVSFATGFWRDQRFTWPGAQPGTAASYISLALVILLAAGRSSLGFGASGYVSRVALFAATLYLGETRGVLAGVLVALAVLLWLSARRKPLTSYLGLTYYALTLGLVLIAARADVMAYILRGGTTEGVTSLDGRIPLWTDSIALVSDANKWFLGFGYGAARVLLPHLASWAGTAHSSWVEILLAIGILGPLLLAADVVFVGWSASRRDSLVPPSLTLSVLALLIVASTTGEGLVLPSLSFVVVALLHVPILTARNSGDRPPLDDPVSSNGVGAPIPRAGPETGAGELVR